MVACVFFWREMCLFRDTCFPRCFAFAAFRIASSGSSSRIYFQRHSVLFKLVSGKLTLMFVWLSHRSNSVSEICMSLRLITRLKACYGRKSAGLRGHESASHQVQIFLLIQSYTPAPSLTTAPPLHRLDRIMEQCAYDVYM